MWRGFVAIEKHNAECIFPVCDICSVLRLDLRQMFVSHTGSKMFSSPTCSAGWEDAKKSLQVTVFTVAFMSESIYYSMCMSWLQATLKSKPSLLAVLLDYLSVKQYESLLTRMWGALSLSPMMNNVSLSVSGVQIIITHALLSLFLPHRGLISRVSLVTCSLESASSYSPPFLFCGCSTGTRNSTTRSPLK